MSVEPSPVETLWGFLDLSLARTGWKYLVQAGTVFEAICATVTAGTSRPPADWARLRECVLWADQCANAATAATGRRRLEAILVAAELAARSSENAETDLDFSDVFDVFARDPFLQRDWIVMAKKILRGEQAKVVAKVPVAVVDNGRGWLGYLQLQLFPGVGVIANHPRQLLDLAFDEGSFLTPLRVAWNYALTEGVGLEGAGSLGGVWELLPWENGNLLRSPGVKGKSLTAAAARGWLLLLQGKKVDVRVLVIGMVGANGDARLKPVDTEGVILKVAKVREVTEKALKDGQDPTIDRIAVFDRTNKEAAKGALGTLYDQTVDVLELSESV
jgi:hypothetical protein